MFISMSAQLHNLIKPKQAQIYPENKTTKNTLSWYYDAEFISCPSFIEHDWLRMRKITHCNAIPLWQIFYSNPKNLSIIGYIAVRVHVPLYQECRSSPYSVTESFAAFKNLLIKSLFSCPMYWGLSSDFRTM